MATTVERKNGAATEGTEEITVSNPATGETVATLKACTPAQLVDMVARARKAQPAWQAL
jgi:acyl-CoA reductase-like NAD-dependent aldehyde dehydrogenase